MHLGRCPAFATHISRHCWFAQLGIAKAEPCGAVEHSVDPFERFAVEIRLLAERAQDRLLLFSDW
jgi:hypothetical protein